MQFISLSSFNSFLAWISGESAWFDVVVISHSFKVNLLSFYLSNSYKWSVANLITCPTFSSIAGLQMVLANFRLYLPPVHI